MSKIDEIFESHSINREEFETALAESGYTLLESVEGGYVPASKARELTSEIESQRERFDGELKKIRAEGILREALIRAGVHNPVVASRAIDMDSIVGSEAEMQSAAQARVASLKASDPYMFRGESVSLVSTGAYHGVSSVDTDMMSDSEYYRHIRMK